MQLGDAVARAFDSDGALARCVKEYVPRAGQIAMAQAVATTMDQGGVLVVEAGTGVGKTFAYLVPTLLSGQKVLLSTATKTLQDQLFGRDIPALIAALGLPFRVALLKGRSSYLCAHRLSFARMDVRAMHPVAQAELAEVERWAMQTRSGDLAELHRFDEQSPVIPLVTSTRENCLGAKCPQLSDCHVNLARRQAMLADIVVVNHHLFFADLNIRESGVAELLPSVQCVVFDEAHQLNEIGVQFLGRQLTIARLERFVRDFAAHEQQLFFAAGPAPSLVDELNHAVASLRGMFNAVGRVALQPWVQAQPPGVDPTTWQTAMQSLQATLSQAETALRLLEESTPSWRSVRERASQLVADIDVFSQPVQSGWVRWLDTGRGVNFKQSPLDIADTMRARIFSVEASQNNRKSWVFTSATLGHDATLAQFVESCGLEGAEVLQVQSPFDYATNAMLYVPLDLPKPADKNHSIAVANLVARGAAILGGRTLVLTTTLRAMREIASVLRQHFPVTSGMQVLLQGEAPKHELTDQFRQVESGTNAGCILVGSVSFWEGVDVPGEALQMVVIDKLPFSPPGDPLVEARSRQFEERGKNPFQHLHVPRAAIALKQGAGRLIRRVTDRGVLVVCDARLIQMPYGRRILAALPTMKTVNTENEFLQALNGLTIVSTTDQS